MSSTQLIWLFVTLGGAAGLISVFLVIVLFGMSIQDTAKHGLKLLIVGLTTGISAIIIGTRFMSVSQMSNASQNYMIQDWKVTKSDQGVTRIEFNTDEKVRAYLEYQDAKGNSVPIFSADSAIPTNEHIFIPPGPLNENGKVWIILNGKRIQELMK